MNIKQIPIDLVKTGLQGSALLHDHHLGKGMLHPVTGFQVVNTDAMKLLIGIISWID